MNKPDFLCRFPCMDPWIGSRYGCDGKRLAIVAESHYLPSGVTPLNYVTKGERNGTQRDRRMFRTKSAPIHT